MPDDPGARREPERLGLAPIRQAYDPQTHQAKCLACPTFCACAPRRRSLFAGRCRSCSAAGRAARPTRARRRPRGCGASSSRGTAASARCAAPAARARRGAPALAAAPHGRRVAAALRANAAWADFPSVWTACWRSRATAARGEADHAVRVADGGGEALADRVQTLCVPGHKAKTKQEAKRAAAERRAAKKKPRVAAGDDDDGDCRLECVPVKTAKGFLAAVAEEEDDDDSWL